jgi:hypothetical protein
VNSYGVSLIQLGPAREFCKFELYLLTLVIHAMIDSFMMRSKTLWALLLCMLFFVSGALWVDRIGLQNDEVLFGAGIYAFDDLPGTFRIFGVRFPTMVMNYVGTVKSFFYRVIVFPIFEPAPASVRIPMLALATVSVWLFYELLLTLADARTRYTCLLHVGIGAPLLYSISASWSGCSRSSDSIDRNARGGCVSVFSFSE